MDKMFRPEIEAMPRKDLEKLQLDRLRKLVDHCHNNIDFYHKKLDEMNISSSDLHSLDDISQLPFTVKQDLRDAYPFGMFAVDHRDAVRVHASSGTTGQASVVGYTENDLKMWGDCVARCLVEAGLDADDTLHISYGYGLFTGGLGVHYGGEALGTTVIPMSTGNTKRQLQLLHDFEATCIACTPSYMLLLTEKAADFGWDIKKDFKLKSCILGAEPFTAEMRSVLENRLGFKVYDIYGLSEIMGPGVSCECYMQNGSHVCEDNFLFEIINPETKQPVPDGEFGELVITTLTKECSPLIRYRTRDITRVIPGQCECGRTSRRLDKFQGRSDDMLIIRGVNVYPTQIESVLASFTEIAPYYRITITREGPLDLAVLEVEMAKDFVLDEIRNIELLKKRITSDLKSNLQLAVQVRIVEPNALERSEGKAKRVFDLRAL